MTDTTEMRDRQAHSIELQRQIADLPAGAAFHQSFKPYQRAVNLLAEVADSTSRYATEARETLAEWRNSLATPAQMAALGTDNKLEVGGGAVVSQAPEEGGFWISTWSWVCT